jgi:PAS domain-containing protein
MIRLSGIANGLRRPLKEQEEMPVDVTYFRGQLIALIKEMEEFEQEYATALEQAFDASPQPFYKSNRNNLTRYMNNVAAQLDGLDKQLQGIENNQQRLGIQ